MQLDDQDHKLLGDESFKYQNNSPDTLSIIILHLWPNAYQNGATALGKQLTKMGNTKLTFATSEERGRIEGLDFKVDGDRCTWYYDSIYIDICTLKLDQPLLPGKAISISTPFQVQLPSGRISRLGHIGQSYQITQWYPKPAVYDQEGWHAIPYLTQGEFYSEFGSFDVSITLPSNYTVGSTGDLQNEDEKKRLSDLASKTTEWIEARKLADDWSEIREDMKFPDSDTSFKTLRFLQNEVHDFGWFADKRFHVLKGEVTTPHLKEEVDVWTMFTNRNAKLWSESIEYMHDAVYYYSLWNGDYPYRHATAVDGTISAGGGMEYPNVTVIGNASTPLSLEQVIMHEVGHNWFYGILGSNERRYTWLDEGLNSYNELRYLSTKYPDRGILADDEPKAWQRFFGLDNYGLGQRHYFIYGLSARFNSDQALNIPAADYSTLNYGTICYAKTAVFFNYLKAYLGEDEMDRAMQAYFEDNKFKHPQPADLEQAFQNETEKELDWLFDDVINTSLKLDYKLGNVRSTESGVEAKLINKGGIAGPVHLALLQEGKVIDDQWVDGFTGHQTATLNGSGDQVRIDPEYIMPEVNRQNNISSTKGVLKRVEPIRFKLLGEIEDPTKHQVFYLPILGMNEPNGLMPGLAFYNSTIPVRKLNYLLAPMFSTKGTEPVGTGELYYMLTPNESSFESLEPGIRGKHFLKRNVEGTEKLRYARIEPYFRFDLRPFKYNGLWDHEFTVSSVLVLDQSYDPIKAFGTAVLDEFEYYNRLEYKLDFFHPVFKTGMKVNFEQNQTLAKTSLEVKNHLNLDNKLKLSTRLFAGYYLTNLTNDPRFNWRMDGQSAPFDYAYDHTIFDRSSADALLSRQMVGNHGGFKIPTALGQSNSGIVALNFKMGYKNFPIGLYADFGQMIDTNIFVADAGIYFGSMQGIAALYIPLVHSKNIQTELSVNGMETLDLIRFELDLNKLNLFTLRRRLRI